MTEMREFPTAVVASLSSGICLCKFGEIHEAAEFLMGHPIWTHHFASKELWAKMKRAVLAQCPGMPDTLQCVTPKNYLEKIAALEAELGPVAVLRKGEGETAMHPLDGIPADKPAIIFQPN